jgi:superfamily II DNA or RNA helicase
VLQEQLDGFLNEVTSGCKTAKITSPLQPHQQRVVERIQQPNQPGLVVAHGLGSGKSLASIAAQEALGMSSKVVVPASLQANYRKEIAKHTEDSPVERDVVSLQAVTHRKEPLKSDLLIVDEAHRLREPGTQAKKVISESEAKKRLLLTASPFYNYPSDIAPLVNIAAGKHVFPTGKQDFQKKYIKEVQVSPGLWKRLMGVTPGTKEVVHPARASELQREFAKWVDYHPGSKDNYPDVVREDVQVPMHAEQLRTYDALLGQAPYWVRAKVKAGLPPSKSEAKDLNAFMSAARQVSNTTAGFTQEGNVHEPKIDRAVEEMKKTLAKNERAKGIVYSNYLESGINRYREKLRAAGIPFGEFTGEQKRHERDQLVKDYNEGRLKVLLLSSAGGEGLDLKGTRLVQVMEPHWNLEKIKQVEGRAIRFKSHEGLPHEEQNVRVQRYLATRPASGLLERWGLSDPGKGADEYLAMLSGEKERLIRDFTKLFPKPEEPREKTAMLLKHAISPEMVERALKGIKGQIRAMGLPVVKGPGAFTFTKRLGRHKTVPTAIMGHSPAMEGAKGVSRVMPMVPGGDRLVTALQRAGQATPPMAEMPRVRSAAAERLATEARFGQETIVPKGTSGKQKEVLNRLMLAHEKFEAQALRRRGARGMVFGHIDPSVVKREQRLVRKLEEKHPGIGRNLTDIRAVERAALVSGRERANVMDMSQRVPDYAKAKQHIRHLEARPTESSRAGMLDEVRAAFRSGADKISEVNMNMASRMGFADVVFEKKGTAGEVAEGAILGGLAGLPMTAMTAMAMGMGDHPVIRQMSPAAKVLAAVAPVAIGATVGAASQHETTRQAIQDVSLGAAMGAPASAIAGFVAGMPRFSRRMSPATHLAVTLAPMAVGAAAGGAWSALRDRSRGRTETLAEKKASEDDLQDSTVLRGLKRVVPYGARTVGGGLAGGIAGAMGAGLLGKALRVPPEELQLLIQGGLGIGTLAGGTLGGLHAVGRDQQNTIDEAVRRAKAALMGSPA